MIRLTTDDDDDDDDDDAMIRIYFYFFVSDVYKTGWKAVRKKSDFGPARENGNPNPNPNPNGFLELP